MPTPANQQLATDDFILVPYGEIKVISECHPVHSATWEALWANGKVGYKGTQHTLPKGRKEELKASTQAAIDKLEQQAALLRLGLARLETMPEKDYDALARAQG